MGTIKITCEGADAVEYTEIMDFQGGLKDLKEEDAKRLDHEILTYGFNSPVHVWKQGKKLWNLDGHQRLKRIKFLVEEEGYTCPPIPVDYIKAKNLKEAKHILLSRVKQYGTPTQQGLFDYLADSGLRIDDVKESFGDLPGVDMEKFSKNFFESNPKPPEDSGGESDSFSNLVHKCPKCGFKFGKGTK